MSKIEYIGKCLLVEVADRRILAVGDLHLGYEEALNIAGVGRRLFGEMMLDFEEIFSKVGEVDEVVLLGDVKHVFGTILGQEREDFRRLLEFFGEKCGKVVIVQGNHDAIVGFLIRETERTFGSRGAQERSVLDETEVRDFYCVGDVCFLHGDKDFEQIHGEEVKMWVIGHAHPAIVLEEGVKAEKYKCFLEGMWEGKKIVIVPSFSRHSEGSDVRNSDLGLAWDMNRSKFKVHVVDEGLKTLDFGELWGLYRELA